MRLTQIVLSGFKSFPDKTSIQIPGNMVGIVGPNGCGKSNVMDAVRWVLGESSAKQLRGENMQDVIFAGSTTRSVMSRAFVELIFDQSASQLAGEWGKYAELSIKRILTRQGESSYLINNQIVRRKDITELFLGTGLGAKGYAVIEQGTISRIIESKPEELRTYIESAAGVSKYIERKKETNTRLKNAREHLDRLKDIEQELVAQKQKLSIQAENAKNYLTIENDLQKEQNLLTMFLSYKHQKEIENLTKIKNELNATLLEIKNKKSSLDESYYQAQRDEHEKQSEIQSVTEKREKVREKKAKIETQIHFHQEEIKRQHEEEERIRIELAEIIKKCNDIDQLLIQLKAQEEENHMLLEERIEHVDAGGEVCQEIEQQLEKFEIEMALSQKELHAKERELAILRHSLKSKKEEEEKYRMRLLQLDSMELNISDDDDVAKLEMEIEGLEKKYQHNNERFKDNEIKLNQWQESLKKLENERKVKHEEWVKKSIEINTLKSILNQTRSAQVHTTEHHCGKAVWEIIKVAPEWEYAISRYLDQKLFAVKSDWKKEDNIKNQDTILINNTVNNKISLLQDSILHHIDVEDDYQALIYWLKGVRCAPDLDSAIHAQSELHQDECWITREGHYVDPVSIVIRGKDSEESILEKRSRLSSLNAEWVQLSEFLQQMDKEIENQLDDHLKYRAFSQQILLKNNELMTVIGEKQSVLLSLKTKIAKVIAVKNQHQEEENKIKSLQEELVFSIEVLVEKEFELENEVFILGEKNNIKHQGRLERREYLKSNQEDFKQKEKALNELYLLIQRTEDQYKHTLSDQANLLSRKEYLLEKKNLLEKQNIDQISDEVLVSQYNLLQEEDQSKTEWIQEKQKDLDALLFLKEQQREQLKDIEGKLPEIQGNLQELILSIQRHELLKKQYSDELAKNKVLISEMVQYTDIHVLDENKLNRKITSLKSQKNKIGEVNLLAVKELNEINERVAYYEKQRNDATHAILLLEKAIQKIDSETKTLFKNTFDQVNQKLTYYFPLLFGGGEAYLALTDEEDLLHSGVLIMARPTGKKNASIHLLSGGEKALTAMSLIFSLFSLNPAPFCLLDEVDAPLDDSNTVRFAQMLKEMSSQVQFLFISHNRLTIEKADQLIGVTMQEKGVSRVVSVDVQKALSMTEITHP